MSHNWLHTPDCKIFIKKKKEVRISSAVSSGHEPTMAAALHAGMFSPSQISGLSCSAALPLQQDLPHTQFQPA